MERARVNRILRQHVRTDQLLGVEAVPRGEAVVGGAAVGLREETESGTGMGMVNQEAGPRRMVKLDRDEKIRLLGAMDRDEVSGCRKCELCRSRTQTVFGDGDVDAPILFIGEGPGQHEDELGKPFVGRAGELLNKMIVAMGYERSAIYIANVVKCRPPNNRTPTTVEVGACWDYLRRQIETIQPQVMVTLGGPAAKMLLDTKEGITRLRGRWHEYGGVTPAIPLMPTFHPAYLLRAYTRENRAKVWSDLQAVVERVKKG